MDSTAQAYCVRFRALFTWWAAPTRMVIGKEIAFIWQLSKPNLHKPCQISQVLSFAILQSCSYQENEKESPRKCMSVCIFSLHIPDVAIKCHLMVEGFSELILKSLLGLFPKSVCVVG